MEQKKLLAIEEKKELWEEDLERKQLEKKLQGGQE